MIISVGYRVNSMDERLDAGDAKEILKVIGEI
jgi:hypothetical protein